MEQFEQAKGRMATLKKDPGNDVKLKIYALFKQVGGLSGCLQVLLELNLSSKRRALNINNADTV